MGRRKKLFRLWLKGSIYYWCSPESPGWKSTGESDRRRAEDYAVEQLKTRARVGVLKELRPEVRAEVALDLLMPTARMSLREYLEPYFIWDRCPHCRRRRAEGKQLGRGHVADSRRMLDKYVLTDPIAEVPVGLLLPGQVEDWRQRVLEAKGPGVANKALSALKCCLREGLRRKELTGDPTTSIGKITVQRQEPGTFTTEELRRLFPAEGLGPWLDRQDYGCFLLAASTGMRSGELLALRWGEVDFEGRMVRVQRAWKFRGGLGKPKWDRVRACPLPAVAARALKALRAEKIAASEPVLPDALVFSYADGRRLGGNWWNDRFHKALKAARIDARGRNLKPHSFRHTLATALADRGQPPEKIRAALGWSNEATRAGYTHGEAMDLSGQAAIVDKLLGGQAQ